MERGRLLRLLGRQTSMDDEPTLVEAQVERDRNVAREAPVTEAHHAGADPGRHLVPLAHVLLRELVARAVLDQPANGDSVADQRDVEDEEPEHREPESALSEPLARERSAHD